MKLNINNSYKHLTVPRSIKRVETNEFSKRGDPLFKLEINGSIVSKTESFGGTEDVTLTEELCGFVIDEFNVMDEPYPHIIKHFKYGGVYGRPLKGFAPYKGKFINWTGNPGIARMLCSDGEVRLIPTFALKSMGYTLPEDTTKNKVFFGIPSKS